MKNLSLIEPFTGLSSFKLYLLVYINYSLFASNKDAGMKGLTAKEEEIMGFFWEKGPLFVKEMLAFYEEPKPHFNTLSTIVRGLEDKGFLAHYTFGNTYQYYPIVSEEDFRKGTLRNVISKYFNNSYLNAVSSLVKEEDISLDELRQLIQEVEKADRKG